jgi:putative photosynthetic complex assembly protein
MSGPIHFEQEPGARAGARGLSVPKPALISAAVLVVFVFALAISARFFGFGAFKETSTAVLAERSLRFVDVPGGAITVMDATTNTVAAELPPATNNFLRGAMRALTRERRLASIGPNIPFRLVRYVDGRLVLHDPATKASVTVTSFGQTQVESFDRLLVHTK